MFSDGVFAIAITLLIIEIKVPKHEDIEHYGGLYNSLLRLWPSYLSYILSFFVIGIYWSNHHWLFSFVRKTNHTFNLLNIFFLMTIAFLPYPTAVLGDYVLHVETRNAAVAFYCFGQMLPVPVILVLYLYATRGHRLVDSNLSKKVINRQTIKIIAGLILISTATILAFNYPLVSIGLIVLHAIIFFLPPDKPVYNKAI